jgi:hypothetical protein
MQPLEFLALSCQPLLVVLEPISYLRLSFGRWTSRRLFAMIRDIVAMPEYLQPGVYIKENDRGPRPIEGAPTSTAAFLGETERGPITPRLVTSYRDYQRWFGGVFGSDKFMPYSVDRFFENGGARLYACRLVDDTATAAEAAFGTFAKANARSWGRRVWARIDAGPPAAGCGRQFRPDRLPPARRVLG